MTTLLTLLFCCSTGLIVLLLSYPLVSLLGALLRSRPVKKDLSFQPAVSILIACYNEELYIRERLDALLDPEEWIPGSELIVVSTGSTDHTNELLKAYEHRPEVKLFFEARMTKIEALNRAIPHAQHDFLVFSDCRQYMKKGSVRQLVANLNDPDVGTVTCTILDTAERSSFFRRLYLFLALCDSKNGSTFNLYGALYAQRKEIFRPIPNHLLFDDFFVAVSTLSQKKRLIQEKYAVLYDVPFPDYYNRERIERLARGLLIFLFNNYQLIRKIPQPTRWWFFVYKYLKLLLPVLICCAILSGGYVFSELLLNGWMIGSILVATLLLFLHPVIRRNILLILRINHFFLTAIFGYVFLKRRSKHWELLQVRRRWFFVGTKK
jgi:biofilm PGA synthesis N-glycosyltransferase PgaC